MPIVALLKNTSSTVARPRLHEHAGTICARPAHQTSYFLDQSYRLSLGQRLPRLEPGCPVVLVTYLQRTLTEVPAIATQDVADLLGLGVNPLKNPDAS